MKTLLVPASEICDRISQDGFDVSRYMLFKLAEDLGIEAEYSIAGDKRNPSYFTTDQANQLLAAALEQHVKLSLEVALVRLRELERKNPALAQSVDASSRQIQASLSAIADGTWLNRISFKDE